MSGRLRIGDSAHLVFFSPTEPSHSLSGPVFGMNILTPTDAMSGPRMRITKGGRLFELRATTGAK
jgi:hypothetical protein